MLHGLQRLRISGHRVRPRDPHPDRDRPVYGVHSVPLRLPDHRLHKVSCLSVAYSQPHLSHPLLFFQNGPQRRSSGYQQGNTRERIDSSKTLDPKGQLRIASATRGKHAKYLAILRFCEAGCNNHVIPASLCSRASYVYVSLIMYNT